MKKILLIFLILIAIANAQQANVVRDAPDTIRLQDVLSVNININNPENIKRSYQIIEVIPQAVTLVQPKEPDEIEKRNALSIKLFKWEIDVEPNKIITLNYKIKPDNVGEYTLNPTKVIDLTTNDVFLSEPEQVLVLCLPDKQCEGDENSVNCPEDCKTGAKDGICDYKSDGICDPDCIEEPDCKNKTSSSNIYFILIGIIGFICIIFLLKFLLKKNTKNL
jgi:hypothetical protein